MLNRGPPSGSQQGVGSMSNGRFAINGLPSALSQLSPAGVYGYSGLSNNGGSGVSTKIENTGYMANYMDSFVNGHMARVPSSSGGLNVPSVTSRLNLGAPQMVSMLGNPYSGSGQLSRNHFQAGNHQLNSMAMLNELNNHDAGFEMNDFPKLNGLPTSAVASQGQLGLMRKQNFGLMQQNREFSIQNEDFPALPGYKGGNTELPAHIHQKEHLHDDVASIMQSQHLPTGRSSGFSLGAAYSSHHQQQEQHHAPSVSGSLLSLLSADSQDHYSHGFEARNTGLPAPGFRPMNLTSSSPGMKSYDQLIQQSHQSQKHSQPNMVGQFREHDLTHSSEAATDQFGMLGLLNVINATNPRMTSLALGIDLTTLGLNLNSSEKLHHMFASPWSEEPAKGEPQYTIPECYMTKVLPALHLGLFTRFRLETLFYVFYSMPKDEAQLYAANELHIRGWFYHKELRLWFTRIADMEPLVRTNTYERGSYYCFDPNAWQITRKDNVVLHYEMLEKRVTVPHQ